MPESSQPEVPQPRRDSSEFGPSASWDALRRRADLLRRVRSFFDDRGFLEVETPLLSADVVVDRHLDPLSVILFDDPRDPETGPRRWLQTSPEFGMKRLLAAGAQAIYQITRAFRGGEVGALHNPEFTLVEWYRVGDDYQAGMDLLAELACATLRTTRVERLTYRQAFLNRVQLDPHVAPVADLIRLARQLDPHVPDYPASDRDSWLNFLLATAIEPQLGFERPTILYDYPASQAALALVRHDDPPVAERFELYVRGVELANGYHELVDPKSLRQRNSTQNELRAADGRPRLPESSRLLDAMEAGLPPCSGVALGFDRLVMVAAGANRLSEVMAFTSERA